MLGDFKYLGVILDSKRNWNHHVQKIIRKAVTTFAVVRRMYGNRWGLRLNMVISSILGYSDLLFSMLPWFGGPRLSKKALKLN